MGDRRLYLGSDDPHVIEARAASSALHGSIRLHQEALRSFRVRVAELDCLPAAANCRERNRVLAKVCRLPCVHERLKAVQEARHSSFSKSTSLDEETRQGRETRHANEAYKLELRLASAAALQSFILGLTVLARS